MIMHDTAKRLLHFQTSRINPRIRMIIYSPPNARADWHSCTLHFRAAFDRRPARMDKRWPTQPLWLHEPRVAEAARDGQLAGEHYIARLEPWRCCLVFL